MAAFSMTACNPDKEDQTFSLNARIEQPYSADGAKVYLDDERWIYWEVGDKISIGSNMNDCDPSNPYNATLTNAATEDFEAFNGVFVTTMGYGSQYFLGLHPQNNKNIIRHGSTNYFDEIKIELPGVQRLRADGKQDLTFARQIFPMVGWYGGSWESPETAYNLDFHSLGAIVRLQVYNTTGAACTVDSIVITSRDENRQISGLFTVHGNTYRTEDPYLDKTSSVHDSTRRITFCGISDGDRASLGLSLPTSGDDVLRSFYLVLPAYKSRHDSTIYHLTMTVHSGARSCSRNFTVNTRRGGITYLPAIAINSWTSSPSTVVGLTGNGTEERPFKVYTYEDLKLVRDAYNSAVPPASRYINNIELTNSTHICIMRSDIEMDATWTSGINNFVGHMTTVSNASEPGIINNSRFPLFQQINAGAVVEGIALKCNMEFSETDLTRSPFCLANYGTIKDCVVRTTSSGRVIAPWSNIAGICVDNRNGGVIDGCRCQAALEASNSKNIAGICYNNYYGGRITGCQATTLMSLTTNGNVAGICYMNQGVVEDCYFATRVFDNNSSWGGIVYENDDNGVVRHCYYSNTAIVNTAANRAVGGIVYTNAGTIDYCWNEGTITAGTVGGIVNTMTSGKIINCQVPSRAQLTTNSASGVAAGMVATLSGGSVENSFVNNVTLVSTELSGVLAGMLGFVSGGTVRNCYDREYIHQLYASSEGATYSNCFVVDGSSSDGITSVSSETLTVFTDLQGSLNDGITSLSLTGAKNWTGAAGNTTPPTLVPYTIPSSKRRR